MCAFKRMVGISEIVAANNLFRTVDIRGLGANRCIWVIDCGEHTADINKTVPASVRKSVTAHDMAQAVNPTRERVGRTRKIDCREGVIAGGRSAPLTPKLGLRYDAVENQTQIKSQRAILHRGLT